MRTLLRSTLLTSLLLLACSASADEAQAPRQAPPQKAEQPTPAAVVAKVTAAAKALIAACDEPTRHKLLYALDDDRQRRRWSNLPATIFPRGGVRWSDFDAAQRAAARALMRATLSPAGLRVVDENMAGRARLLGRDPSSTFFFAILGRPGETDGWAWMLGGHHLGINATVTGDDISLSPMLTGGQPMTYTVKTATGEGRVVRQLLREETAAFKLVRSLDAAQRRAAILDETADWRMSFGPNLDGVEPLSEGLRAAALTEAQRGLLLALIRTRVDALNRTHAERAMTAVTATLKDTYFSWHGPTRLGAAASWRIQGPRVLMEYCPQSRGDDAREHVHTVYRDPLRDYGGYFRRQQK